MEKQKAVAGIVPATSGARKPYTKPEYRYEEVFETMALACGKTPAGGSQCNFNRKNS